MKLLIELNIFLKHTENNFTEDVFQMQYSNITYITQIICFLINIQENINVYEDILI